MGLRGRIKRTVKAVRKGTARGAGMAAGRAASRVPGVKRTVRGAKNAPAELKRMGSQIKAGSRKLRAEIGGSDAYQKALDARKRKLTQGRNRRRS